MYYIWPLIHLGTEPYQSYAACYALVRGRYFKKRPIFYSIHPATSCTTVPQKGVMEGFLIEPVGSGFL